MSLPVSVLEDAVIMVLPRMDLVALPMTHLVSVLSATATYLTHMSKSIKCTCPCSRSFTTCEWYQSRLMLGSASAMAFLN